MPPLARPALLVGIVAAAEIDLGHMFVIQQMAQHMRGQDSARRCRLVGFVMSEFHHRGDALVDKPDLCRDGPAFDPEQAEPELAEGGEGAHHFLIEVRKRLRFFPAARIHILVFHDAGFQRGAVAQDCQRGGLPQCGGGLAAHRVA